MLRMRVFIAFQAVVESEVNATDYRCSDRSDAATLIRERYQGARILLVDDDPLNRVIIQYLLKDYGLQVDASDPKGGSEGMRKVSEGA